MTTQLSEISANPFAVKTPENLTANELVELFVPYPEFANLQVSGHQFLNGHRGSGKSMMLRMMSPDSQMLSRQCTLFELPYFGVYLSIKTTELNAPEYARLELEPSGTVLSEHVLTTKLLSALFLSIRTHCLEHLTSMSTPGTFKTAVESFFNSLRYAGWVKELPQVLQGELNTIPATLDYIVTLIDEIQIATTQYIKRRSFSDVEKPYQGALLGFQDILLPLVKILSDAKVIPAPVYFLLDDADNLTEQQTQILNTWVSYRSTNYISLKISTQLNYKTYRTTSQVKIESPHDFSTINFTSVHTGSVKEQYPKLVAEIVRKRLTRYGLSNPNPYTFFPQDETQEEEIKQIELEYKKNWEAGNSGAYRARDDAYRLARPEYIRRLSGISKQGSRYKYAGYEQLVHVSSGIIRFFLEPAARMFTEQYNRNDNAPVTFISASVQDQELRKQADDLLLQDFDYLESEAARNTDSSKELKDIQRLRNIVSGIGALFKQHIMDETASQRRVFSFSVSGEPSPEIKSILRLGVIHGYFYLDSIGTKNGRGRATLYVLTRRLAPAFSLDPTGFSGYLTVKDEFLHEIATRPGAYITRLKKRGLAAELKQDQPSFWEGHENE